MTKYEIIEEWANNKEVERIVKKYNTPNKDDLAQIIYMALLNKDDELIQTLYSTKQFRFYISRMISQQVLSIRSDHYKQNVKRETSIEKEIGDGIKIEDILAVDEDRSEPIEEGVDTYLNKLPPQEKEMLMLLMLPPQFRTDDVADIQERYGLTNQQYRKLLPKVRAAFVKQFFELNPVKKKETRKLKYNKKLAMYNMNGDLIKEFDNAVECFHNLSPLGFKENGIYMAARGEKEHYKGYVFKYLE